MEYRVGWSIIGPSYVISTSSFLTPAFAQRHFCPSRRIAGPIFGESAMNKDSEASFAARQVNTHEGWHTLRHTFGTLMKANGEDIKTIQELLRHSNYQVTADTYTQAVTPIKRAAQTKLVRMILPAKRAAVGNI